MNKQLVGRVLRAAIGCFLVVASGASLQSADDLQEFDATSILQAPGVNDPAVSDSTRQLLRKAAADREAGQYDDAIGGLRAAYLQVRQETEGEDHPLVVEILDEAVDVFIQAGKYESAESPLETVSKLRGQQIEASQDPADQAYQRACLAGAQLKLGCVRALLGDLKSALPPLGDGVNGLEKVFGASHEVVRIARQIEVSALWDAARLDQTIVEQKKVIESLGGWNSTGATLRESDAAKAFLTLLLIRKKELNAARDIWDVGSDSAQAPRLDTITQRQYRGLLDACSGDFLTAMIEWRQAKGIATQQQQPGRVAVCEVLLACDSELRGEKSNSPNQFKEAVTALGKYAAAVNVVEIGLLHTVVGLLLDRSIMNQRLAECANDLAVVIGAIESANNGYGLEEDFHCKLQQVRCRLVIGDAAAVEDFGPEVLSFRKRYGRYHRLTIAGFIVLLRSAVANENSDLAVAITEFLCDVDPEPNAILSEESLSALIGKASGISLSTESPPSDALHVRWKQLRSGGQQSGSADFSETLLGLAAGLQAEDQPAIAIQLYRDALLLREQQFGSSDPKVGAVLLPLAHAYRLAGDAVSMRQAAERAQRIWSAAFGSKHPLTLLSAELTED